MLYLRVWWTSHDLDHFLSQFEISRLEFHISSRTDVKYKTEINVDDVSFFADEDVSIMSILNLQHVTNDAVSSLTLDEVLPRYLVIYRIWEPVLINEIFIEATPVSFAHLISTDWIRYHLNYTSDIELLPCSIWDSLIGKYIEIQAYSLKYSFKHLYDLKCQIILTNIIEDLKNTWFEFNNVLLFCHLPLK